MLSIKASKTIESSWFSSKFFAEPPHRSFLFVSETIFCLLTLAILGFVIIRYWSQWSIGGICWLGAVGWSIIIFWTSASRCYQRLHRIFVGTAEGRLRDDRSLSIVMSAAAEMIYRGLFVVCLATTGVLIQLADSISCRR